MSLRAAIASVIERHRVAGWGVCGVEPFDTTAAAIAARVAGGLHAGMSFTFADGARATDVRRSFPWARRLVVVAWPYAEKAGSPGPGRAGSGRVARFATEDHYRPLRALLAELVGLMAVWGHRGAVLVDDNRLVDRAAAVRAGVGWWGKNTMVLTPGVGPWILIGSVVTDADLESTAPMRRDCGGCSACLPACPTGALVAPGVLDARRCLAYWAQAPGVIPSHYREPMGDRLYGCDDCLEACPPGRRLLQRRADVEGGRVELATVLAADDTTLLRRFGHFYIPRRRPRYLRRNALVALGNAGGPDATDIAAGYAGHPDWLLRLHAVWALGRLGGARARAALAAAGKRERHDEVRAEIAATTQQSLADERGIGTLAG